jgi:hypothetical protein
MMRLSFSGAWRLGWNCQRAVRLTATAGSSPPRISPMLGLLHRKTLSVLRTVVEGAKVRPRKCRPHLRDRARLSLVLDPARHLGVAARLRAWPRNFRPGRPSKRTNSVWAITRWRASGVRLGAGLSRSHKFVGLRADHRIAFAGTVL